jgi:replicative DNA helicase
VSAPSAYVDDGRKPVFRVRTRLGREVRTTASHPFLTPSGWQPLVTLSEGDTVAVPRELPVFGSDALPTAEVGLLGYLVGSVLRHDDGPVLRCVDPVVALDLRELGDRAAIDVVDRSVAAHTPQYEVDPCTALIRLVHRHRIADEPDLRRVPEAVYRLPRHQLAAFLNRVLTIGASTWVPAGAAGRGRVLFASPSARLVRDLQHLFLRFCINAAVRAPIVAADDAAWVSHEMEISGAEDLVRLVDEIGVLGQLAALQELVAHARAVAEPVATSRSTTSRSPTSTTSWPATCSCTTPRSGWAWRPTPRSRRVGRCCSSRSR